MLLAPHLSTLEPTLTYAAYARMMVAVGYLVVPPMRAIQARASLPSHRRYDR